MNVWLVKWACNLTIFWLNWNHSPKLEESAIGLFISPGPSSFVASEIALGHLSTGTPHVRKSFKGPALRVHLRIWRMWLWGSRPWCPGTLKLLVSGCFHLFPQKIWYNYNRLKDPSPISIVIHGFIRTHLQMHSHLRQRGYPLVGQVPARKVTDHLATLTFPKTTRRPQTFHRIS